MKSVFTSAVIRPAASRAEALAAFNASSQVAGSDMKPSRLPRLAAILGRKKGSRGGSDGGPPAGMVMPDMSIGAVPIYT